MPRTLLTQLRHPVEPQRLSLCGSDLISRFLLPFCFFCQILLHYVFLHLTQRCAVSPLFLSWLSCHQHVVCQLIASDLGPVSGWLVFGGPGGDGGVLSSSYARLLPSVCVSVSTPLRSRLLDRCQSPTLGLSTLHPHTHRGNYSLGACLLSLCSTIYHQSVHRHLSSSPVHPDITGPQGLRPTSAAIT